MDESSPEYQEIMSYIEANPAGVVSTVNADNTPHSAVVYLFPLSHHTVCFATRDLTRKFQNISERPDVSITIYDKNELSTLQAMGKAFIASKDHMLPYILDKIDKMFEIREDSTSPVGKLHTSGDYVLVGIELSKATLTTYKGIDNNMGQSYKRISIG